jgi:hypothetical protein
VDDDEEEDRLDIIKEDDSMGVPEEIYSASKSRSIVRR